MSGARVWPVAIVAMLALTVGANAMLIWKASDENGTALEPDYYRKAVAWDSTQAGRERSHLLGWTSEVHLVRRSAEAELIVTLRDANGRLLEGARVMVAAIHNLEGGRFTTATLDEREPGRYGTRLRIRRIGVWELRLEATRAGDRHLATHRVELEP